jgi:hypothetical protein
MKSGAEIYISYHEHEPNRTDRNLLSLKASYELQMINFHFTYIRYAIKLYL